MSSKPAPPKLLEGPPEKSSLAPPPPNVPPPPPPHVSPAGVVGCVSGGHVSACKSTALSKVRPLSGVAAAGVCVTKLDAGALAVSCDTFDRGAFPLLLVVSCSCVLLTNSAISLLIGQSLTMISSVSPNVNPSGVYQERAAVESEPAHSPQQHLLLKRESNSLKSRYLKRRAVDHTILSSYCG